MFDVLILTVWVFLNKSSEKKIHKIVYFVHGSMSKVTYSLCRGPLSAFSNVKLSRKWNKTKPKKFAKRIWNLIIPPKFYIKDMERKNIFRKCYIQGTKRKNKFRKFYIKDIQRENKLQKFYSFLSHKSRNFTKISPSKNFFPYGTYIMLLAKLVLKHVQHV